MRSLAIIALVLCSALAYACKCAPSPPPDPNAPPSTAKPAFEEDDVVFEGSVSRLEVKGWPTRLARGEKIEDVRVVASFRDVRLYHGSLVGELSVETGIGGGDCGFEFLQEQKYLVFAWKEKSGRIETSICSPTSLLEDASETVAWLRGISSGKRTKVASAHNGKTSRVCGRILRSERTAGREVIANLLHVRPAPLPFLASNEAQVRSDGSFCFADVRPGKYIAGAAEQEERESDGRAQVLGFYPTGTRPSEATPFEINSGSPPPFLVFGLHNQRVFTVSGWVTPQAPTAAPGASRFNAMLMPKEPDFALMQVESVNQDGEYQFDDVPEGEYSLFVTSVDQSNEVSTIVSSVLKIEVTADMQGVRIDLN